MLCYLLEFYDTSFPSTVESNWTVLGGIMFLKQRENVCRYVSCVSAITSFPLRHRANRDRYALPPLEMTY